MRADRERLTAVREEDPGCAGSVRASLAADLESADASPTAPQRELLAAYEKGMAAFASKWTTVPAGPYASLARRPEKLGITADGR